jgi:hypothetical protein
MFTRLSNIFFLACTFMLLSCKNENFKEDTKLFEHYLQTSIGQNIPEDSMNYVVISEYGCEGCIGKTITKLADNSKTLFIVNRNTYNKYIEPKLVPDDRYIIDTTDKITRLKYHKYNVGVVQTSKGRIYNIIQVEYESADSILQTIK